MPLLGRFRVSHAQFIFGVCSAGVGVMRAPSGNQLACSLRRYLDR